MKNLRPRSWLMAISLSGVLWLVHDTVSAETKSVVIGPDNLSPSLKFYSGYAGELHQLNVSVAPGYKFQAQPSLSANPNNLRSGSGSSFSLVNMQGEAETHATVVGSIAENLPPPAPDTTGGGSSPSGIFPFSISLVAQYFRMHFIQPTIPFVLKGKNLPVSVTLVNAIGAPTSGSVTFSSSLGSFGVNNPANVGGGMASSQLTVSASGGTKGKISAAAGGVDITDGRTASGEVESNEITAVEAILTSDPIAPLGISATSSWPSQQPAMTKADLILTVTPNEAGAVQTVKEGYVLNVEALTTNPGYTPSGLGSVTRQASKDSGNKVYWQYQSYTEAKTEKHPKDKVAHIVKKMDGETQGAAMLLKVSPVFRTLTSYHQHAAGTTPHQPTTADYEAAAAYVIWKYNVPVGDIASLTYLSTQNHNGFTLYQGKVSLGSGAFSSENWCASTIGHENIHGGQPESYFTRLFKFNHWTVPPPVGPKDFYKLVELPAYEWQRDNAVALGLSDAETTEINNSIEQINNGQAPEGL